MDFKTLCEEFTTKEEQLLGIKAGDYATENDRLWNFNVQGQLQGIKPSQVALTHLLKHVVTISKAVMNGEGVWAWECESGEGLKQRFADARNYLLLVAACLEVERKEQAQEVSEDYYAKRFKEINDAYKQADCEQARIMSLSKE